MCTTFYRLRLEDKVCTDAAARFAAFNTGLVNRRYDDIYACFEPDTTQSSSNGASWASARQARAV